MGPGKLVRWSEFPLGKQLTESQVLLGNVFVYLLELLLKPHL